MLPKPTSHYEVLEIEPDATPKQIHDAYLRLKAAYSKSSTALYGLGDFGDESNTQNLLAEIDAAFQTLSDPQRRKEYDERHGIVLHAPKAPTPMVSAPVPPAPRVPVAPLHGPGAPLAPTEPAVPFGPETEWRGELLKTAREKFQISLEEMSNFTKISKTYLRAIEDELYDKLPAPVFLRGFLIQIARKLRLPEEKVAASYLSRAKQHATAK